MGRSSNSHGKKTDKETQSPLLKIFKDIMQKEHNDLEKATLVREKRKKKRKQHSSMNSKSDQQASYDVFFQKSGESSGAEKKKNTQFNVNDRNRPYSGTRTRSFPFQSEKRESWWLWGEPCVNKQEDPSTCSCVSCQLKKIMSNEYACVGCLIVLFTISVIVAFMLVFKSMTIMPETEKMEEKMASTSKLLDSNSMTNKLNKIEGRDKEDFRKLDFGRDIRRSVWDSSLKELEAGLSETDFGDNSAQDMDSLVHPHHQLVELSAILDPSKVNDGHVSPKLRNFYKKLMETDAQIKTLKKSIYDNPSATMINNRNMQYRLKRSLFHHHKNKKEKVKTTTQTTLAAKASTKNYEKVTEESKLKKEEKPLSKNSKTHHEKHGYLDGIIEIKHKSNKKKPGRLKRYENDTEARGIVFEKKQLIVKYLDDKPKFPKCSHAPSNLNSHEKLLKHPFYKNSERLDQLLDEFLDKNIHEIVSDPLGIDNFFGKEAKEKKNKFQQHEKRPKTTTTATVPTTTTTETPTILTYPTTLPYSFSTERLYDRYLRPNVARAKKLKTELTKFLRPEALTPKRDFMYRRVVNDNSNIDYITPSNYDVVISVSTLMNPDILKRATDFASDSLLAKLPSRKLMQTDEEQEELLGYEDLKEVLSDDMATHDDTDRQVERKKRQDKTFKDVLAPPTKYSPPGIINPNWKGAVPLYPDELNSMVSKSNPDDKPQNKEFPNDKETSSERNDVDYIEDYLTNKYNSLVKMAQAYSDYGVLDGKKETAKNVKTQDKGDRRIKMLTENVDKSKERVKRGSRSFGSEGISFQVHHLGRRPCDDDPTEFFQSLSKHFKIGKPEESNSKFLGHTTLVAMNPNVEVVYYPNRHKFIKDPVFMSEMPVTPVGSEDIDFMKKDDYTTTSHPVEEPGMKLYLSNDTTPDTFNFISKARKKRAVDLKPFKNESLNRKSEIVDLRSTNESSLANDVKIALEEVKETTGLNTVVKRNKTAEDMGASEFFSLLSSWFRTLAGVSPSDKFNKTDPKTKQLKSFNDSIENITKEISYPMYDSDMIENIGHRSRVLLSFKDDTAKIPEDKNRQVTESNVIIFASTDTGPNVTKSQANDTKRGANAMHDYRERNKKENETVVKRNAVDEPNLVFWNDIYDDEYGIKIDPLDDELGSKRPIGADVVKKSAVWIQDKVKKMSDSLKKRSKDSWNKFYKGNDEFGPPIYSKNNFNNDYHKISKREEMDVDAEHEERKANFAVLTAHMQEVCKQASQAVQQTRNIRQNEDKDSQLASGMMQQLVKLMSDLVDYEVQQKTCLRLPGDLKDFLDWLTMPVPSPTDKLRTQNVKIVSPEENQMLEFTTTSSEKEDVRTDARSECLGTLHAVQDLMMEYSQLSEEDKNKVGGVKEYLEDQIEFLNKQLTSIEEINLANIYAKGMVPFRFRRDTNSLKSNELKNRRRGLIKHRQLRKLSKFMRNSGKKHTKTTANSFECLQVSTDVYKKEKRDIMDIKKDRYDSQASTNEYQQVSGYETIENPSSSNFGINQNHPENNLGANDDQKAKNFDGNERIAADLKKIESNVNFDMNENRGLNNYFERNGNQMANDLQKFGTIDDRPDNNFMNNQGVKNLETSPILGVVNFKRRDTNSYENAIESMTKRNIQDVYYKAIEDAKKLTTAKNPLKNVYDNYDKADIERKK